MCRRNVQPPSPTVSSLKHIRPFRVREQRNLHRVNHRKLKAQIIQDPRRAVLELMQKTVSLLPESIPTAWLVDVAKLVGVSFVSKPIRRTNTLTILPCTCFSNAWTRRTIPWKPPTPPTPPTPPKEVGGTTANVCTANGCAATRCDPIVSSASSA